MGIQNAAVRRLKVPDITTTVVTMAAPGWPPTSAAAAGETLVRRMLAVLMLLAGAALGAFLVLQVGTGWALAVGALMIAVVLAVAALSSRVPRSGTLRGSAAPLRAPLVASHPVDGVRSGPKRCGVVRSCPRGRAHRRAPP